MTRPTLPDDRMEAFHAWTAVPPRRRWRIDWFCVAVWGALALFTLAFWTAVAWGIVTGMVL